jgi:hypothetical protein
MDSKRKTVDFIGTDQVFLVKIDHLDLVL